MSQEIIESLTRLENKIDSIESRLTRLDHIQSEATLAATSIVNSIDTKIAQSNELRWQAAEAADEIKRSFEQISLVELVSSINKIITALPEIERGLSKIENINHFIATTTNSFDDSIAQLNSQGFDVHEFQSNLAEVVKKLSKVIEDGSFKKFLDSGIIDPSSIEIIGQVGKSLAESHSKTVVKPQFVSFIKGFKDQNIRYTIRFFIEFCRSLGKNIHKTGV